ncbi:hypothetical protein K469DRAFT_720428 [Zopfia rhizophila CBS 207.26]|uniref:DUF7137 domain-containing protein n=1 Tax=Zopfia rhizophila CBS 207.26 TaxID=1314779 RepID=A0A6A6EKG8_9PEZI|nr:hypothetical protein K469DRAFT_720428 [Zopfia rhizophila CBS 207.26]
MRPSQLLAAVVALSQLSAAWPDFGDVKAVADVHGLLYGRQDNNDESSRPTATADEPKSTNDSNPSNSEASTTAENTAKETGKATASDDNKESTVTGKPTGSVKASGTKSGSKTKTTISEGMPAGGIQMITPAVTAGAQYYKVGDWVSFAWNYTSLSFTPTAIDVLATCTANQATYTLAVNQSVEETGMVYWDTGAYQATASVPLLTEQYTLIIYDSNSSVSATAKAGYLGAYNQFTFGMYTPQPYTPWADYKCPTCNSAMSAFESMTIKALLLTSGTTIASLFYFAYSFGVL